MAESIDGPLRVTEGPLDHQTLVTATSMHIGMEVTVGDHLPEPTESLADGSHSSTPARTDVNLDVGDDGASGGVRVHNEEGDAVIVLNGTNGTGTFGTGRGRSGGLVIRANTNGPVIQISGDTGRITFLNARLEATLAIDGIAGDIEFQGADCTEDFDVVAPTQPGSVLVARSDGRLEVCWADYDTRAVGVRSGAGGLRPALRLNRQVDRTGRVSRRCRHPASSRRRFADDVGDIRPCDESRRSGEIFRRNHREELGDADLRQGTCANACHARIAA
jgi:hypothetical protein